jgi:hypothetical protein
MNRIQVFIVTIIAMVVFILPLSVCGEDLVLTSDGKVPGKPFVALQKQIDNLQLQIDEIEAGPVKAYVTKNGGVVLLPGIKNAVNLMSLNLLAGEYVTTMTIQASFYPGGFYVHDTQTSLSCSFVDGDGNQVTGHLVGGKINGTETHAITMELTLFDETEIFCRCSHVPFNEYADEPMDINSVVWTAIKASELDNQMPTE